MRLLKEDEWPIEICDMLEEDKSKVFLFEENGESKLLIVDGGFGVQEWVYMEDESYKGYTPANWWPIHFNEGEEWKHGKTND